jgi:large subunit ribosomal protein L9
MAKKLLLIKDVEGLGRSGKLINVKPGYARNYLLPQGYAVVADVKALRMQARLQEESNQRALQERQESEAIAQVLQDVPCISTAVKVDHEGHMYGSVSALEIVSLLQEQANVQIEKRMVQLKHPIKQTGEHKILLRLKEGVESSVLLKIMPEEEKKEAEKS